MLTTLPPVPNSRNGISKTKRSKDFTNPLTWYNSRNSTVLLDEHAVPRRSHALADAMAHIDPRGYVKAYRPLERPHKPNRGSFPSRFKAINSEEDRSSTSDFDNKVLRKVKAAQSLNSDRQQKTHLLFTSPVTSVQDVDQHTKELDTATDSEPQSAESCKPEIVRGWLEKIGPDQDHPKFILPEHRQLRDMEPRDSNPTNLPELRPRPRLKTALKGVRKPRNNMDKLVPEALDRDQYLKRMQSDLNVRFRHKERECKFLSGDFQYTAPAPPKPKPTVVKFDMHVDMFALDRYETLSFFRGSQSNTVVTMHTPRRKRQIIEEISEEPLNSSVPNLFIDASRLEQSHETRRTECLPGSALTRAMMDNKGWYNRPERKHVYSSTDDIHGSNRSLALHSSHASILQLQPPDVQRQPRAALRNSLRRIDKLEEEKPSVEEEARPKEDIPDSIDEHVDVASTLTSIHSESRKDNLLGGVTLPKHTTNTPENSFLREVALTQKPPTLNRTITLSSGQNVTFVSRRQVDVFGERRAHTFHSENVHSRGEGRDGLMLMPVSRASGATYTPSITSTNPMVKLDLHTPASINSSRKVLTQSNDKASRRRKKKRPDWSGSDDRLTVDANSYLESCRDQEQVMLRTPDTSALREDTADDPTQRKQAEVAEWQQMVAEREETQTTLNANTEYDPLTGTQRPTASLAPQPPMSREQLGSRSTTRDADPRPVTRKTNDTGATGTATGWPSEVDEAELLRAADEQDAAERAQRPRSADEDSVTVVSGNIASRSIAATVGTNPNLDQ